MKIDNREKRGIDVYRGRCGNALVISCHAYMKSLKYAYHKLPKTKVEIEKFLLNSCEFYNFLGYIVHRSGIRMNTLRQEIDVFVDEIFEFLEEQKK